MKTARPLLALAALLSVSGCSDSDEPCFVSAPPSTRTSFFSPQSFEVGASATLQVSTTQAFSCTGARGEEELPDSVTAQVYDPENTLVPSEVRLTGGGTSATVHFTPRTTGRHHVLVAFAPVGSVQQLGAYVARPWSGSSSAVMLPLPRCTQLDRTTRGTWVCDGVAMREQVSKSTRLGTSSVAPDVAVAGNVVWVVGEGRVRRFIDNGLELELTGSLLLNPTPTVKTIQSRLATENELLVLDEQHLHRFIFTNTGVLDDAGATVWPTATPFSFGIDSTAGLLVRVSEERVMVVWMEQGSNSRACPFQLTSEGLYAPVPGACQSLPGTPVGYVEGAVWTRTGDTLQPPFAQTLHLWQASEEGMVEQGALVLDSPVENILSALRPGFIIPDIALGTYPGAFTVMPLAPPRQGPLGLEKLPGNPALPRELRTVSPRFYWEGDSRLNTGTTTVYSRPGPP